MKRNANTAADGGKPRFLCGKCLNRAITIVIAAVFVLCTSVISYAAQNVEIQDNVLTYTFSTSQIPDASRYRLYILANGAQIETYGRGAPNRLPETNHTGNKGSCDISEPIGKGKTSGNLWFTDTAGKKKSAGSKVEFTYSCRNGVFTATVKIYDPDPEVSGLAFTGITSDGSANYYSDVQGTHDISEYVRRMYEPEEPGEDESIKENIEDIKEEISGGGTSGGGSNPGYDPGTHRPPCILRRIKEYFSA